MVIALPCLKKINIPFMPYQPSSNFYKEKET